MNRAILVTLAGLSGAWACASMPPPRQQVVESASAIRAAEALGAENYPQASLHLKLARDQHARGNALISQGENERAALALRQSRADAELAQAKVRAAQAEQEAAEARQRVNEARSEEPQPGEP